MKRIDFVTLVLLLVAVGGFTLVLAAADLSRLNPIDRIETAAVLINNDVSELHCGNIGAAMEACRLAPFDEIVCFGSGNEAPTLRDVRKTLDGLRERGVRIGLLYLTGHGSLYRSKTLPEGEACVMLKDAPLRVHHLSLWFDRGPCVVYSDVCYSPDLIQRLEDRLDGDFLFLTDKPANEPERSCRGVSKEFWEYVSGTFERSRSNGRYNDLAVDDVTRDAWERICSRGIAKRITVRSTMASLNEPIFNPIQ